MPYRLLNSGQTFKSDCVDGCDSFSPRLHLYNPDSKNSLDTNKKCAVMCKTNCAYGQQFSEGFLSPRSNTESAGAVVTEKTIDNALHLRGLCARSPQKTPSLKNRHVEACMKFLQNILGSLGIIGRMSCDQTKSDFPATKQSNMLGEEMALHMSQKHHTCLEVQRWKHHVMCLFLFSWLWHLTFLYIFLYIF